MLTPRENYIRFLRNEAYEWTPCSFDQVVFMPSLIPENISRGMVAQQTAFPESSFGGRDWFGVDWYFDPAARGSMEKAPLLGDLDDLENWVERIHFPALEELDWEQCARDNREYLDPSLLISSTIFTGFFERLISFVGFEDAAVALIDDEYKEYVHSLFARLADFYIDLIAHLHRYFNVELVTLHDDWGTQTSTMFSVETHSEMILPYIRKVAEGAHAQGVFIEQHSCGKIEKLVPNIIASGVDTWRGQAVNDKQALIDTYGDAFKFGVEGCGKEPVSDEKLISNVNEILERNHGKRIWLSFPARTANAQKALVLSFLHSKPLS